MTDEGHEDGPDQDTYVRHQKLMFDWRVLEIKIHADGPARMACSVWRVIVCRLLRVRACVSVCVCVCVREREGGGVKRNARV